MSFRHSYHYFIVSPKWKIHVLSRMSGVPSSAKARYLHPSGLGSGILIGVVGVLLWSGCGGMVDPFVLGLVVDVIVLWAGGRIISGIF